MTYSECVFVVSVTQHAKHMHPIILPSLACIAPMHFSTYLINGTIFRKMLLNITCIFICSTKTVRNISLFNKNSVRYYHGRSQIFMLHTHDACQILIKLEYSQQIFKKIPKYQISWKFIQWELRSFMQTDRWLDMMKNLKTIKGKYITLSIHS